MKTIEEILKNYKDEYEVPLEDRFGKRFAQFLPDDQLEKIGFGVNPGYEGKREIKEWTEENVLAQLKKDLEFGWMKCCDERSISASLMAEVVLRWCKVLENGLENLKYGCYGDNIFQTVAERYGIELKNRSFFI